jgi:heme exporter protein D
MNWNSPAEFFAMGGYALYVWGSVIACVLIMVMEPMLANKRLKDVLRTLRHERIADEINKETP